METTYHYNDKVALGFDPIKHIYTINGEIVSGVTTVLQVISKPMLINWAAKMAADYIKDNIIPGLPLNEVQIKELSRNAAAAHRQKKDLAADTGTLVHDWIERFVNGENPEPPMHPGMRKAVNSFLKWWAMQDIKVIKAEQKLCSPKMKLAGTADLICELNGKLTILDWKTGSGIYPEAVLQMGAYAEMYEEEFGKKVKQIGVVNCSVKATFGYYLTTNVKQAKETYKTAYKLQKELKELEKEMK